MATYLLLYKTQLAEFQENWSNPLKTTKLDIISLVQWYNDGISIPQSIFTGSACLKKIQDLICLLLLVGWGGGGNKSESLICTYTIECKKKR